VQGLDAIEEIVHAGLTHRNDQGVVLPQLAEAVPTIENGGWKVESDGRMETTWKIKANAKWHDGVPVTTDDLRFAMTIEQDKDLGIPLNPAYALIERVEAPDPKTITLYWKQPFIEADAFFSYWVGLPVPAHILEAPFKDDPAGFAGLPYWNRDFIGAGPYKMKEWAVDSHAIVQANDDYVLGRPKIDEMEIKFIPDPTTLMANILAGMDMSLGRALSVDQAVRLKEQWPTGTFATRPYGWLPIHTQFVNPNPPVITDVRFRRAVLEGIDRQQLVDSLFQGQANVSDTWVAPGPEYEAIKAQVVHYQFDPRAGQQALQDLGYTRRPDGSLADSSGQHLTVSMYTTTQNEMHPKAIAAVSDYLQQNLGIAVDQNLIPPQRAQDREYRATFPSFEIVESNIDTTSRNINRFRSTSIALPENRFTATGNNARYSNPEVDAAIQSYVTTLPTGPRLEALGRLVHIQTDQIPSLVMANTVTPNAYSNRLVNITGLSTFSTEAWNVQEWDLKE